MHYAIYLPNSINRADLLLLITQSNLLKLPNTTLSRPAIYSPVTLQHFLKDEHRYDKNPLTEGHAKALHLLSEGEQKQALLNYLLASNPDYLIVDNVFDSLDSAWQKNILTRLEQLQKNIPIIQLLNRREEQLPFIKKLYRVQNNTLIAEPLTKTTQSITLLKPVPVAPKPLSIKNPLLISMKNVSVSYDKKTILSNISWDIYKGELWQLQGPNGSGKSTLLQLINGDNPKGYGQEIYLFGHKKGSGESVWDIKKNIGTFTHRMYQNFTANTSVENMVLSGFFDSVGLYKQPSKQQCQLTQQWLDLVGMSEEHKTPFAQLSLGKQRLLLIIRAMVKHPPLLLLDEPTAGLSDHESQLCVSLINRMAKEKTSAIIFVSHRKEKHLQPDAVFQLTPTDRGSIGEIKNNSSTYQ